MPRMHNTFLNLEGKIRDENRKWIAELRVALYFALKRITKIKYMVKWWTEEIKHFWNSLVLMIKVLEKLFCTQVSVRTNFFSCYNSICWEIQKKKKLPPTTQVWNIVHSQRCLCMHLTLFSDAKWSAKKIRFPKRVEISRRKRITYS